MMKLLDYIYYKFDRYYQGNPNSDFYPIMALTWISLFTLSITINALELIIHKKLIDLNNDPIWMVVIGVFLVGFFCTLFYFVYVKSERNYRIAVSESLTRRILGWIGILTLIVGLFFSAVWLYLIRFVAFA